MLLYKIKVEKKLTANLEYFLLNDIEIGICLIFYNIFYFII